MIFRGTEGQQLEFRITNYQFPEIVGDVYDRNWLNIYFHAQTKLGNHKTVDPALLTSDVEKIIIWFEQLSSNITTKKLLDFIEPNIELELLNSNENSKLIRLNFELEFSKFDMDDERDYFMEMNPTNSELLQYAKELRAELNQYPPR